MGRHALLKREPQEGTGPGTDGLPTLITLDPATTAAGTEIVSAAAPTGLTTITLTETRVIDQSITTIQTRTKTVTDALEYASLSSAAAASATQDTAQTSSRTAETATATSSSAASGSSSSNLATLIPAIVVPIAVVLLASLGLFWFFMRRRAKRELQSQPEFVMAGKGEKLSSRSNSSRSGGPDTFETKFPAVSVRESGTTRSPPVKANEFKAPQIGVARPLTPQEALWPSSSAFERPESRGQSRGQSRSQSREQSREQPRGYTNFSGPGPRPHTAGRNGPPPRDQGQSRSRSNSTPGNRGPPPSSYSLPRSTSRQGKAPSPVMRNAPSPVSPRNGAGGVASGLPQNPRQGPSPVPASAAFRLRDPSPNLGSSMSTMNRAQPPAQLDTPGAYNGQSSISQYSPIVKEASSQSNGGKRPPPPIKTSTGALKSSSKGLSPASPSGTVLTEENVRIARFANSSRLASTAPEPSPSPKLPPPATRSQLIPRDSPKEERGQFFGAKSSASGYKDPERASVVSHEDEYEDIDAKSDVSSLNEFERFDFGEATNSRAGSAGGGSLKYFASHNSPATGRGSPFGDIALEKW